MPRTPVRFESLRGVALLFGLSIGLVSPGAVAQDTASGHAAVQGIDRLVRIDTRPGVTITYWWMPRSGMPTVLLISGGEGGIGFRDGTPQSQNFLIRSRDAFALAGFNVALLGNASDMRKLNPELRGSPEHMADIRGVVADLRARTGDGAVWLVGTSQGTISASNAAVALGPSIDGLVLTATVTDRTWARHAAPNVPLERIAVPVLVHHHRRDTCRVTRPDEAARLVPLLVSAPVRKFMGVDGGGPPSGDPCEALHHHGYVGMEAEAVSQLGEWIRRPVP